VTWSSGPHTTFLSLDGGPSGAPAGKSVTLAATLLDETTSPFAPVAGVSIQFSVNGQNCMATTDGNGVARCPIVVKPLGSFTLTATFAGNASYAPSSDNTLFITRDLIFADGFDGLR
jgi:Big-like domain-containing protein